MASLPTKSVDAKGKSAQNSRNLPSLKLTGKYATWKWMVKQDYQKIWGEGLFSGPMWVLGRVTWNPKITHPKRKIFFQTFIFGSHMLVFWGGNRCCLVFEMYPALTVYLSNLQFIAGRKQCLKTIVSFWGWLPHRCKLFGFRVVDAWFGSLAFYMRQSIDTLGHTGWIPPTPLPQQK